MNDLNDLLYLREGKMSEEKIILFDSDEAATRRKVDGWVSSKGLFYGNSESAARYDGCTHRACEDCGKPAKKMYLSCPECREKKAVILHKKRKWQTWDGKTPLYSDEHYKYFFDADELADFMEENNCTVESLRLLICEPKHLTQVETDIWEDLLPEDIDFEDVVSKEVLEALDNLNNAIADSSHVSWFPGEIAAEVNGV